MNIDPGRDVPLFIQIAEGIEEDVFTGVYAEQDRVPSTNELSALLGINPHTVLKGMNILVDEGIIYKRRGMGMYVQTGAADKVRAKRRSAFDERFVAALVAEAKKLGLTKEQVVAMIEKGYGHA
ncbi:GntR family transcriptional regulator [Eggerthella guodeyinii]|uniref:GntR family transcriptional regulator n=2 Tax=Eggerthella TaxID=84111 RepID=A0A6L7IUC3_9ACTN|nr:MULTISPECIES: GntR family transcriptional regulator [Eggerthella]MBC5582682.1 GntR family transcriptional regulator [Eggerthella hominis]QOS69622.1 GntR family transcriptional regulator [Eggerthella guodeyinii]